MYCYQAFQLSIDSELAFPELCPEESRIDDKKDVTISYGEVSPKGLEAPAKKTVGYQANNNIFWLNVPNVARFLVTEGRSILIDPDDAADEDSIRVFLLGSCFGALLMQRGLFLLHGNAVRIGDNVVTFVGKSGAGKSTLAALFHKRGHSILADDVCALNAQGEVIPSFPQIKLWADAAKKLSIDTTGLRKIRPQVEKYALPMREAFYSEQLPLKMVYVLNSHNQDGIEIENLVGADKIQPLRAQTYRLPYIKAFSKERQHKMQCLQLAGQINIARITRPSYGCKINELADFIEADLGERGFHFE